MDGASAEKATPLGVILWDVDGTLVQVTPSRQDKHLAAAEAALSRRLNAPPSWAGRTDAEILYGLAAAAGVDFSGGIRRAMLAELDRLTLIELGAQPSLPSPGAGIALRETARRGWVNGLATGNSIGRARAKIASAGLSAVVDFRAGFFGSRHLNRSDILAEATRTVRQLHPTAAVVVIGDTPLDVAAARACGLPVVAVATGVFTRDFLARSEADLCLMDLRSGLPELLDFLSSPP